VAFIDGNVNLDNAVLSVATFAPLVGAAVLAVVPKREEFLIKAWALGTSVFTLLCGLYLVLRFNYDNAGAPQFDRNHTWIDVINSNYHVFIDGLSLPLFLLSMVVTTLCIVYSWNHWPEPKNPKAFLMLMLVLETGMLGTFIAEDLILFFVFFELVLLPMYFMIGVWGGENRQYAALKFFLFTLFGSALMILGFLALYFKSGGGGLEPTFDIPLLIERGMSGVLVRSTELLIFGSLFMGFAIKVPMFPFHTWLPDAHTQAPTVGSVILAAVLLKLGTYGFVRIAIPILPAAAKEFAPLIAVLATIGIIYGALGCLAQTDMKRLIAFSSVAHMGFVMLGIATLTDYGINAAVFGMVAHGLITGMLFFVAGSVKERFHTLEIKRLGGLLVQAPKLGWILGFCSMASLGLPGLAGFWGEFPAILSTFNPAEGLNVNLFRTCMVIASIGTVFAAGYLLWLFQRTAFGTPKEEWATTKIHDVERPEWLAWTPLLLGIVLFGVLPGILFDITDPAVTERVTAAVVAQGK
jgi:NADH-quinone oxidoreductase subunit M